MELQIMSKYYHLYGKGEQLLHFKTRSLPINNNLFRIEVDETGIFTPDVPVELLRANLIFL